MRKYSLSLVALSTFFAYQGHSEFNFGVMGGGNYTTFTSGVTASTSISSTTYSGSLGPSGLLGYQFGGLFRYDQDTWAFEADLLYTNRSAKWAGELSDGASSTVRNSIELTLRQIELPIIGYYKVKTETFADYRFGLGMYVSYGIQKISVDSNYSNVPGSVVNVSRDYTWSEFGFKRINFGGLFGLASDFKIGQATKLGVELRGQVTFNNMTDTLNPSFGTGGDKIGLGSIDILVSYLF
ncbi:MAG: outer membrane beta-barrel protein [Bdellovibrionota bacterium]